MLRLDTGAGNLLTAHLHGEVQSLEHASDIYEFKGTLGSGSFGKVYEAMFKPTGEIIAVKVTHALTKLYNL